MNGNHVSFVRANVSIGRQRVWLVRILVLLGLVALFHYYRWWWSVPDRLTSPWLILALILSLLYTLPQFAGSWFLYLAARPIRSTPPPIENLTIDVFVVTYNEPYALVERAVTAVCAMRGNHRTWLLDDGPDPQLRVMAERLGAGYLTRSDRTGNKPGNLNSALSQTDGDIIVIFDVDHTPTEEFLERTTGYFRDPAIGFVQVMLTFCNENESWVTRAATEASLDFYNPTSLGMDNVGSATLMGSNALIRRTALESIDGYQYGLADDLATSIALHAAGWQSVYVAEPLAPGLVPPDLTAWFTQQLKWARGVFEVQLTTFPRLISRLTWGQRLSYAVRVTYYLAGPFICIHLFLTIVLLFAGSQAAQSAFQQYLLHLAPLGVIAMLIRQMALATWRHPSILSGLIGRAVSLVYSTWPIYTLAWLLAILRRPLSFRLTPKVTTDTVGLTWLLPQIGIVALLGAGATYAVALRGSMLVVLLVWILAQMIPLTVLLWHGLRPRRVPAHGTTREHIQYQFGNGHLQMPYVQDSSTTDVSSSQE